MYKAFESLCPEVLRDEGIKVTNDKLDPGKMTMCGISKRFWPNWIGWMYVTEWQMGHITWDECVKKVMPHVIRFYYVNFWKPINGDEIIQIDHDLARLLLACVINLGVERPARNLQISLNIMNRDEATGYYLDLRLDGILGMKTIDALRFCKKSGDLPKVAIYFFSLIVSHYVDVMVLNPNKEKFARGWLNRMVAKVQKMFVEY